jgi:PadR family transcriptional regulator PadR
MISKIKGSDTSVLIQSKAHRDFLKKFESDLLRGIGKLSILKVIQNHGEKGVYGYQLLKDLKGLTNNMLIIKEGTLYPLLRNLEKWGSKEDKISLIQSYKEIEDDRTRKYYYLTEEGERVLSHLEGFFLKLLESISGINDFEIILKEDKYIFCHNCKTRIDYSDSDAQFCEICGHKLADNSQEDNK